jgi:hypothetical protein
MKRYEFMSHNAGKRVEVSAPNEDEARRLAMVQLWSNARDAVVPYAPDYKGTGLLKVR